MRSVAPREIQPRMASPRAREATAPQRPVGRGGKGRGGQEGPGRKPALTSRSGAGIGHLPGRQRRGRGGGQGAEQRSQTRECRWAASPTRAATSTYEEPSGQVDETKAPSYTRTV